MLLLIPLLPLIGFVLNGLLGKRLGKGFSGAVGSGVVLGSFLLSVAVWMQVRQTGAYEETAFTWLQVAGLQVDIGFLADQLSSLMMLIVTGIGFLIHLYSTGYMSHDEGFHKFFAYLNLFIFSMLLLVMGNNYLLLFFGWEGVGLCSYLLIGFWYQNKEYGKAARKAFIMNRIGDLGLLIGMFMLFAEFGSLNFRDVLSSGLHTGSTAITFICVLFFIGAMGKSAQIPLYTWLPDAMAGPTPVSALIHAATMVTAGIYLVARSGVLYTVSPDALQLVMWVGLTTAVFAATIGVKQNDIKKVLAYSTVSQLGFMFVALGVGAYTTAMFHVTTHAFFKALLFLGSGSVIHAMGGEQDIRKMGGLRKHLPVTHLTFLIGTLAIAGVPPLAGFFSKDEILTNVFYGGGHLAFILLCVTSVLTAIYMLRLYFLTFGGSFRGTHEQEHHLHESPLSMTLPLMVLAVLSVLGGFLGVPEWMEHSLGMHHTLNSWLAPVVHNAFHPEVSEAFEFTVLAVSVVVLLLLFIVIRLYYITQNTLPEPDEAETGVAKLLSHKYYIDEVYDSLFAKPVQAAGKMLHNLIEKPLIDGIVNGIGDMATGGGKMARLLQSGNTELYLLGMVLGMVIIFILNFIIS